jgi:hypothetical protein
MYPAVQWAILKAFFAGSLVSALVVSGYCFFAFMAPWNCMKCGKIANRKGI